MISLEQMVNRELVEKMGEKAEKFDSKKMLSLMTYIGNISKGMPVNVKIDGPAKPFFEKGKAFYYPYYILSSYQEGEPILQAGLSFLLEKHSFHIIYRKWIHFFSSPFSPPPCSLSPPDHHLYTRNSSRSKGAPVAMVPISEVTRDGNRK